MTPWRLARATGRARRADLCEACETPLQEILQRLPRAARPGGQKPLEVVTMDDIEKAKKKTVTSGGSRRSTPSPKASPRGTRKQAPKRGTQR